MTQTEFIIALLARIDDTPEVAALPRDPRAKLWPSELITLGVLFVLYGRSQRRFHRWLSSNFADLFPRLPERTRLFRLLARHRAWADLFLAEPSLLNVGDSLGIELIHPRREGRSDKQVGRKGKSNGRWVVGVKVCPLFNGAGRVFDWDAETANAHDGEFQRMLADHPDAATMTDKGFHRSKKRGGDRANLLICERGQANVRMVIETVFSCWVRVWAMKKIGERGWAGIETRIAFACAAWNLITDWATEMRLSGEGRTSLSTAWVPI